MSGYGVKRWLYSTVRWRGRSGLVMDVLGEWLYVEFLFDAKGNHYRKRWATWLSKNSTVELVEPYVPLRSIWAEKRWEGRQRTLETRAQKRRIKDRLEGK